jgi:hypothetical protein
MPRVVAILVVVIGGSVVAGLVLMYVGRWRADAERVRCTDNLRRICQLYLVEEAQKTKAFPAGTLKVADLPPGRRLSWVVPGLTRLGHEEVADLIDLAEPWDAEVNRAAARTAVKQLICPALSDFRPNDGTAPFHYPGLAGVGANVALKPPDAPGAGMFRYHQPTLVSDVKDGLSNTLMLMETLRRPGPWIAGGMPTIRPLDPADRPKYLGPGRPFGGAHPGGANAANADGSARFINENVNPRVLELLVGIADGGQPEDSQ